MIRPLSIFPLCPYTCLCRLLGMSLWRRDAVCSVSLSLQMSGQRSDWRERLHANPSRMEQEPSNRTKGHEKFASHLASSIIDSLSEIDIIEDYSSRSTVNLV